MRAYTLNVPSPSFRWVIYPCRSSSGCPNARLGRRGRRRRGTSPPSAGSAGRQRVRADGIAAVGSGAWVRRSRRRRARGAPMPAATRAPRASPPRRSGRSARPADGRGSGCKCQDRWRMARDVCTFRPAPGAKVGMPESKPAMRTACLLTCQRRPTRVAGQLYIRPTCMCVQ
jgi:hypothetical protein